MSRHTRKKRLKVRVFPVFILMVIIVLGYKSMTIPEGRHLFEKNAKDKNGQVQSLNMASDYSVSISSSSLHSPNAVLIRLNDNTILMEKKSGEKIYPASLTKMMTAIVAIENLPNLQNEIKLTHYTFGGLYSADAAMAGFQAGEKVRAIDLLYGVLLPSGAETCIGLHDENHYTTVGDLAVLLNYGLQNDTFREIFTWLRHSTQPDIPMRPVYVSQASLKKAGKNIY